MRETCRSVVGQPPPLHFGVLREGRASSLRASRKCSAKTLAQRVIRPSPFSFARAPDKDGRDFGSLTNIVVLQPYTL